MKKAAAIFCILMGLMMFGSWTFLFLFSGYPQARTVPVETGYLLVAEFLTATALVTAGYGMLSHRKWAVQLILVALGELIYCTIRFAGELGQAGSLAGLVFFSSVAVLGLIFTIYLVVSSSHQQSLTRP